jgi:pyridoxine 5-phosphate synthase
VQEIKTIQEAARHAVSLNLECHAGHGLSFLTVSAVAAIPEIVELNIGHFIIGEAVFMGLKACVVEMKRRMREARA